MKSRFIRLSFDSMVQNPRAQHYASMKYYDGYSTLPLSLPKIAFVFPTVKVKFKF